MSESSLILSFEQGSILIPSHGWNQDAEELIGEYFTFDERTGEYRALAKQYRDVVLALHRNHIPYLDKAKGFSPLILNWTDPREARDYQREAHQHWQRNGKRGVVTLPTGSGKSFLGMNCILSTQRSSLIIAPTLDLVAQWSQDLERAFSMSIGTWGGGSHDTQEITVSTYDSALIHMEREGGRFGLIIFDECHHLPGASYRWIANMAIAPYRLGLSATPERGDGAHLLLQELIGPEVYRVNISTMKGRVLSHYKTELVEVPLLPEEERLYKQERSIYTQFIRHENIDFSSPTAWSNFIFLCSKSEAGKRAMAAYKKQKHIIRQSESKIQVLWEILWEHRQERIIIFTNDNETAYHIGERFTLPVLTHQTSLKERKYFLAALRSGALPWIVTSRVLNEGVDVPEVNVAIVVSGTGSVREHVQRLGRILRKQEDKQALLIELISAQTGEAYQSQRRRQHEAYQ